MGKPLTRDAYSDRYYYFGNLFANKDEKFPLNISLFRIGISDIIKMRGPLIQWLAYLMFEFHFSFSALDWEYDNFSASIKKYTGARL